MGSDVIWNYEICGRESDMFFFLDWVECGHKKIAYAASFGSGVEGPDSYEQLSVHYLKQFDAISIREKEAAEKAKQKTGNCGSRFWCAIKCNRSDGGIAEKPGIIEA